MQPSPSRCAEAFKADRGRCRQQADFGHDQLETATVPFGAGPSTNLILCALVRVDVDGFVAGERDADVDGGLRSGRGERDARRARPGLARQRHFLVLAGSARFGALRSLESQVFVFLAGHAGLSGPEHAGEIHVRGPRRQDLVGRVRANKVLFETVQHGLTHGGSFVSGNTWWCSR